MFLTIALGCLAVLSLLMIFIFVTVMVVVGRGEGRGEEEDMLVGQNEDIGLVISNGSDSESSKKFNLTISRKLSTFCDIFCMNCKQIFAQERYIAVDK